MALFRIPATSNNAASRTVEKAEQARQLGYTNVQTHYEPTTGTHTVTGEPPKPPETPRGLFRR